MYQDHDGTGGERGQVPLGRVGVGGGDRTDRQREGIPDQECGQAVKSQAVPGWPLNVVGLVDWFV